MSVGPLVVEIIAVCCVAMYLLHRYGNWRNQHILVTLAAFVSWYFSLLIIVILPLDVSSTFYRQCQADSRSEVRIPTTGAHTPVSISTTLGPDTLGPDNNRHSTNISFHNISAVLRGSQEVCTQPWSFVPPDILPTLWRVVYWTSQVLTWLILPMMQSYATAGDFTVIGKVKSALIENAIFYGSYMLIFIVCLIYVAIKPELHMNGSQLKVLAITASNTWGLFLLVLLLGYGLVEVPRMLWNSSKQGYMLSLTYFKIAKLSTEKSEAEENLEDILDDVKKAADTIQYNHPLRKNVDTILLKCPETVQVSVKRNMDDYEDYNNPTETPTEKSLIRLHKNVIKASQNFRRTQCQWNMLMEQAFDLEDVAINEVSTQRKFIRSFGSYDGIFKKCYNPKIEWYWRCVIQAWSLKVLSVLLCIVSAMVVWSEVLFFIPSPTLSFFAIFVDLARKNYAYFYIELACCLTITYLAICAYYTVFKIRVFNYYYMASHHQTDENSLLFLGMLLCRLTPPLCLNFLGLIHLDSHITNQYSLQETAYTQIMGHMDVISFISDGFNIYFPLVILVLCVATYFRLGARILQFLGFQQFIGDDDITGEFTDEGRELVRSVCRKRQRREHGDARRKTWAERFGDTYGAHNQDNNRPGGDQANNRIKLRDTHNKYPSQLQGEDRLELLSQTEPIDYIAEETDPFKDETAEYSSVKNTWDTTNYTSRHQVSPRGRSSGLSRSNCSPLPKNLFDDV